MTDLLIVVGARPNFMKADAVVRAARETELRHVLVHTGQHYDRELSEVFFNELGLPEPDIYLDVGSGSHAEQTARIMLRFESELRRVDPGLVVVVGDVNSTLACSLVAIKERYAVAHVEAGLRTYDPWMPEEINRRLCDHLSTYLYTTSRDASENLLRENIDEERIVFVGNTMIDTLLRLREVAQSRGTPAALGLTPREYVVATLHRPENVDDPDSLRGLLEALGEISQRVPVVLPLHPRTRDRISALGLEGLLREKDGLIACSPLGYLDFVGLAADARLVVTDSGGVQEETTVLGVTCLTVRDRTERPVTVSSGTNSVVGREPSRLLDAALGALAAPHAPVRLPELWDGHAGERIVEHLHAALFAHLPAATRLG